MRAPLMHISLEELVPQDHFYRHLEWTLPRVAQRDCSKQTELQGGIMYDGIGILIETQLTNLSPHCRAKHELTSPIMEGAKLLSLVSRSSQRSHQGVGDSLVLRHG
jgi:hypothetical protein